MVMTPPNWKDVLNAISGATAPRPPHARLMRLPGITGWESGRVWGNATVDRELLQPQGNLFGGWIAAVADEVLGMAAMTVMEEGEIFSTSACSVQFFRPVNSGTIGIEARVVNRARSSVYAEATFISEEGELIAKASATQVIRRPSSQP